MGCSRWSTAWDGKEAPVLEVEMLNPLEQTKSGVLLFITGVFFAIYYAAQYWSYELTGTRVLGAFVGLGAVGLLPAIAAVQVAKDRALQALDPRDWFHLIRWMKTRLSARPRLHPHLLAVRLHPARHAARRARAAVRS